MLSLHQTRPGGATVSATITAAGTIVANLARSAVAEVTAGPP
jgi:hypothetical protein